MNRTKSHRINIITLLLLITPPCLAQEQPRAALGLSLISIPAQKDSLVGDLGWGGGLSGTWTVFRSHPIKFRVDGTLAALGKGPGGYDSTNDSPYYDNVPDEMNYTEWRYHSKGVLACLNAEAIFPSFISKKNYFIAGAGLQCLYRDTTLTETDVTSGISSTKGSSNTHDSEGDISLIGGFGVNIGEMQQLEFKVVLGLLSGFMDHFGQKTQPDYRNPPFFQVTWKKRLPW